MNNITLSNLSEASDVALVACAHKIVADRESNRREFPGLYGRRPGSKERNFRLSANRSTAYAVVFETLKAMCHLDIKASLPV